MKYAHIVACSRNRIIGTEGRLPWHLPADLKRFKELTLNHVIIMGRKTYESIGRPLPGRFTIVVSRQNLMLTRDVSIVHSLEAAYELAERVGPHWDDEIFIIGGGEIYRQSIGKVSRIYLTEVQQTIEGDTSYPDFDRAAFVLRKEEDLGTEPASIFYLYERKTQME